MTPTAPARARARARSCCRPRRPAAARRPRAARRRPVFGGWAPALAQAGGVLGGVLFVTVALATLPGCQDSLGEHWVCGDLQTHASGCTGGCTVSAACEAALAEADPRDPADASTLAWVHACVDCLATESAAEGGTCRDCETAETPSCRAALAAWLDAPCFAF